MNNILQNNINSRFFLPQDTVNRISGGQKNANVLSSNPSYDVADINKSEKKPKKGIVGWIIGASAATLVATAAIISLISPKFFSKNINKLKIYFEKQAEKALSNSKTKKFYDKALDVTNWVLRKFDFANSINNLKDIGYAKLCKSKFMGGENSFLVRANNRITDFFNGLAKNTVYRTYHNTNSKYNHLVDAIIAKKDVFTPAEWAKIEQNIKELQGAINNGFSDIAISNRIRQQKEILKGLDKKVLDDMKNLFARKNYKGKSLSESASHIDKNLKFFSQEIIAEDKKIYGQNVENLKKMISNQDEKAPGKLQELLGLVEDKLPKSDYEKILKTANRAEVSMNKAVYNETNKYFDKHRDLSLGSAPTDIVTIAASSLLAGVVIANANDRDDRISKALTKGIPIIGTIGTALVLSANMIAGTKAIICSGITGIVISKIGGLIDFARHKSKEKALLKKAQNPYNNGNVS